MHRAGLSGQPLRAHSELCMKVFLHTAQAVQWTRLDRECPGWASRREPCLGPASTFAIL